MITKLREQKQTPARNIQQTKIHNCNFLVTNFVLFDVPDKKGSRTEILWCTWSILFKRCRTLTDARSSDKLWTTSVAQTIWVWLPAETAIPDAVAAKLGLTALEWGCYRRIMLKILSSQPKEETNWILRLLRVQITVLHDGTELS